MIGSIGKSFTFLHFLTVMIFLGTLDLLDIISDKNLSMNSLNEFVKKRLRNLPKCSISKKIKYLISIDRAIWR